MVWAIGTIGLIAAWWGHAYNRLVRLANLAREAWSGIDVQLKRRHDLLRAGIELYEMKPGAADGSLRVRGRVGPAKVSGLHAKTYAVDGERVFIGSFNFDLRSVKLNTEMGLVIDSAAFARELRQVFEDAPDDFAYRVRVAPDGERLQWLDRGESGEVVVHDVDPETTVWQRLQVGILSGLPIDWLL